MSVAQLVPPPPAFDVARLETEAGVEFADQQLKFRKPDVSVVRKERLAGISPAEGHRPIPADLAVEVISPNDLSYEVADKVEEYLEHGFPQLWVIHPNTRTVAVHRANGTVSLLHEKDETALPAFKCRVAEFFST